MQNHLIHRIGRTLIAILFLVSGIGKIMHFDMYTGYMASGGLPVGLIPVLLVITILIEVGGSLMLISGWKSVYAAIVLALFLIPATLTFHPFWRVEAAEFASQLNNFLKNLAIFGGLMISALYDRASKTN